MAAGIDVAMLGARMHYAVPRLLHEAGLLGRLYTDSDAGNKPGLAAGTGSRAVLARRRRLYPHRRLGWRAPAAPRRVWGRRQ